MAEIVRTDDVLGGDPRLEGTRVGVLYVYECVVEGEHSPVDVADQLTRSLGEVYSTLAYLPRALCGDVSRSTFSGGSQSRPRGGVAVSSGTGEVAVSILSDEHVGSIFITTLRSNVHEAVKANEAFGEATGDEQLLRLCKENEHLLVTHDKKDFAGRHRQAPHALPLTRRRALTGRSPANSSGTAPATDDKSGGWSHS